MAAELGRARRARPVRAASLLAALGLLGATAFVATAPGGSDARSRRQSVALAPDAQQPADLGRRSGLFAAAGAWLWARGSERANAAVAETIRAQVEAASQSLHNIEDRVAAWKGSSADGGAEVKLALAGTFEQPVVIDVGTAGSLGVEVEGLIVTAVSKREFGWKSGDVIYNINGEAVANLDELRSALKKFGNVPVKIGVKRLVETPFPTLQNALRRVYEDTDVALPEVEDVMKHFQALNLNAAYVADDILALPDLKPDLKTVVSDVDKYQEALSGKKPQAQAAAGANAGSMDDLFR